MLLLSIRPLFADKIFRGQKTVELRRRLPRSKPGEWIAVYATMPEKKLVGLVQVAEIRVATPECLWQSVGKFTGLNRSDYTQYFYGAERAVGIMLCNPVLLTMPLTLEELREVWKDFHPPQAFRYLNREQVQFVVARSRRPSLVAA